MKGIKKALLRRKKDAHKGDFGHVFILAGSRGFIGAACLASRAALLSGAGLVTLGVPKSQQRIAAVKVTEAMTKPFPETREGTFSLSGFKKLKEFIPKIDVLALGPGLTQNTSTGEFVRKIIKEVDKPMVIDADALNALKGRLDLLKNLCNPKIITPHPGEMARLLDIHTAKVQQNREKLAKTISRRYNIVTVLKGYRTIVAEPRGKLYINNTGNPAMAKGGSGDVLTGIIAALLAQVHDSFEAAKIGVYVHGLAGDLAEKEKGQLSLLAGDIIDKLPAAFRKISK